MAHSSLFQVNTESSSKSFKDRLGEVRGIQSVDEVVDGLLQKVSSLNDKVHTAMNAVTDLVKLGDLKDASGKFDVLTTKFNSIRGEQTADNTSTLQLGQ